MAFTPISVGHTVLLWEIYLLLSYSVVPKHGSSILVVLLHSTSHTKGYASIEWCVLDHSLQLMGNVPRKHMTSLPPPVSIKDIFHERTWLNASIFDVRVECVVETKGKEHGMQLKSALEKVYGERVTWKGRSFELTTADQRKIST